MPVKRLPESLVKRLKRKKIKGSVSGVINRYLGRMENIDHRRNAPELAGVPARSTSIWGRKVRQMDVSRNYPKTELVIKRADYGSAPYIIAELKKIVREHNKKYFPKNYVLVMPKAYAISDELIAMAKTDAPSVVEIIGSLRRIGKKTKRGRKFWKGIKSKQGHWLAFWKRWSVRKLSLRKAAVEVCERTGMERQNLLLLGYRNGKFVFMPLVDLH